MGENLVDGAVFEEVIGEFVDVLLLVFAGAHRDDEVEVADGVAGAAERTGGSSFFNIGRFEDVFAELFGGGFDGIDAEAAGGALENFAGFDDVFFGARAEAGEVAEFFFAGELFDVGYGGSAESFPEEGDFLWPEGLEAEDFEKGGRIFGAKLGSQGVIAGGEDFADVLSHVVANAGKFCELFVVLGELFDALGDGFEKFGGFFVGAVAADDSAVDLEELSSFAKDAGDVAIFHGGIIGEEREEAQRQEIRGNDRRQLIIFVINV